MFYGINQNFNIFFVIIEVTSLQTTVVSKNEQVEELKSKLDKKEEIEKELESIQESKSCLFWINRNINNYSVIIEVTSLQTIVISKNEQVEEHQRELKKDEIAKELQKRKS